jgi:hypothetical protein
VSIGFGHGGISPSGLNLEFVHWMNLYRKSLKNLKVRYLDRTGPEQKQTAVCFSHHENGIARYKDFHDPLPVDGVYRCLGVFRGK